MKTLRKFSLILLGGLFVATSLQAQQSGYMRPHDAIAELIEAPSTPGTSFTRSGEWMLLSERPGYPSIEELAEEELRIAGMRINPATSGPSRAGHTTNLKLRKTFSGEEINIKGLPANAKIGSVSWSPDETKIAFSNTIENGIELWVIDVATATASKINGVTLVNVLGSTISWMADSKNMIVTAAPKNRGQRPPQPKVPSGPIVQESSGNAAPSRTYQDLLANPYDELLFEYYGTNSLLRVDVAGNITDLGLTALNRRYDVSPDGKYIMVETIQKPFSYLVPSSRFPYDVDVYDANGKHIKKLASRPLDEERPTGFDATVDGPRSFNWRADTPATVYWVEAKDGGDPRKQVEIRDVVMGWDAPFAGSPRQITSTKLRFGGITWSDANFAILNERWTASRTEVRSIINPANPAQAKQELIRRSYDDIYNDPGSPLTIRNDFGRNVLLREKDEIFMTSSGGSPEGDMPFLSKFNIKTKKQEILWRCEAPYYERMTIMLDHKNLKFLTLRESENDVPNYWVRDLKAKTAKQITDFPHPNPQLAGVQKQLVKYKRNDGVQLSAVLYTPEGYDKDRDGPLPVLMWAYPREYVSAAVASQVRGSQYTFTRLNWGSPLFWVLRGYAVLDRTEMPIVGEDGKEPNDSFVEQLVANAEAAINTIVDMGVADRNRIGVGGHSYGAFMTANLLAHSDLFAAGIARSGAYNRTLTPFGFQNEERTYWEAPDVYNNMSPFMNAEKVNEPILLIHGEADNNSGTFPIQSERFYNALKGHGATTRLVMLPHESHGYAAKESVLHTLYEMDTWLEKYVKNAPTKPGSTQIPKKD
jgi:dipeptidyl aminopeptidase/acylaminoacyl peptidase